MSQVPLLKGGDGSSEGPPSRGRFVVEGYLVAGGGMMRAQGGIPFPLNNLPCQCGPNRARFFFFFAGVGSLTLIKGNPFPLYPGTTAW